MCVLLWIRAVDRIREEVYEWMGSKFNVVGSDRYCEWMVDVPKGVCVCVSMYLTCVSSTRVSVNIPPPYDDDEDAAVIPPLDDDDDAAAAAAIDARVLRVVVVGGADATWVCVCVICISACESICVSVWVCASISWEDWVAGWV